MFTKESILLNLPSVEERVKEVSTLMESFELKFSKGSEALESSDWRLLKRGYFELKRHQEMLQTNYLTVFDKVEENAIEQFVDLIKRFNKLISNIELYLEARGFLLCKGELLRERVKFISIFNVENCEILIKNIHEFKARGVNVLYDYMTRKDQNDFSKLCEFLNEGRIKACEVIRENFIDNSYTPLERESDDFNGEVTQPSFSFKFTPYTLSWTPPSINFSFCNTRCRAPEFESGPDKCATSSTEHNVLNTTFVPERCLQEENEKMHLVAEASKIDSLAVAKGPTSNMCSGSLVSSKNYPKELLACEREETSGELPLYCTPTKPLSEVRVISAICIPYNTSKLCGRKGATKPFSLLWDRNPFPC